MYLIHIYGSHVSTSSTDVGFTAITSKNEATLCKLDVNENKWRSVVASISLNLSKNSLTQKCYFIASSSLKIKYGKCKGMQEKYLSWVHGVDRKKLSLRITVRHHEACRVMPNSDPE